MRPVQDAVNLASVLARISLAVLCFGALMPVPAEESPSGIEELAAELRGRPGLEVEIVPGLPSGFQGPINVIGRYDRVKDKWERFDAAQHYGEITAETIEFLGHQFGEEGFVLVHYRNITDREVVTCASITTDRRMVLYIMDDEAFSDGMVLTVGIGPEMMRYLLERQENSASRADRAPRIDQGSR